VTDLGFADRVIELQPRHDLELPEIEDAADKFCGDLVPAPGDAKRTFWRDLGRSNIEITYPLPLELICDFRRIRLLFITALPLAIPAAAAAFEKIVEENNGVEPAIYVDEELREWVLYRTQATDNLTRFFIAAQVGHILLHVREIKKSRRRGRFFLTSNKECREQAAMFARALLMPRAALKKTLKAELADLPDSPEISEPLSRLEAAGVQREMAAAFATPAWSVRPRVEEIGFPHLLENLKETTRDRSSARA